MDISRLRAEAVSISVRSPVIDDAQADQLAVELTSYIIGHDETLAAAFTAGIDEPIYQSSTPALAHLVPVIADYLAPRFGTAPVITIKQLAAYCFSLAVMKARGEA